MRERRMRARGGERRGREGCITRERRMHHSGEKRVLVSEKGVLVDEKGVLVGWCPV